MKAGRVAAHEQPTTFTVVLIQQQSKPGLPAKHLLLTLAAALPKGEIGVGNGWERGAETRIRPPSRLATTGGRLSSRICALQRGADTRIRSSWSGMNSKRSASCFSEGGPREGRRECGVHFQLREGVFAPPKSLTPSPPVRDIEHAPNLLHVVSTAWVGVAYYSPLPQLLVTSSSPAPPPSRAPAVMTISAQAAPAVTSRHKSPCGDKTITRVPCRARRNTSACHPPSPFWDGGPSPSLPLLLPLSLSASTSACVLPVALPLVPHGIATPNAKLCFWIRLACWASRASGSVPGAGETSCRQRR